MIRSGAVSIKFAVKNPSNRPAGNTWKLHGKKGTETVFLEVIPGYKYGATSPKAVSAIGMEDTDGTGSRYGGAAGSAVLLGVSLGVFGGVFG